MNNTMIEVAALWTKDGQTTGSNGLTMKRNLNPEDKAEALLTVETSIVGRLWAKESKGGRKFYSGFFFGARCLVFRNEDKKSDKAPDYRVMIAPKDEQEAKPKVAKPAAAPVQSDPDDDLPF